MQQIRASLTRLKNRIQEKVPDQNDIFGYAGVTRAALLECIDRAYSLTGRIEDLRGGFALVTLKRKIQPHLEVCKEFLEDGIDSKKAGEKFDKFLSSLTGIHDEISLAYVVHCSDSLRTEEELERLVLAIKNLETQYSEVTPQITDSIKNIERLLELRETAEQAATEIDESVRSTREDQTRIVEAAASARATAELITKYESETKVQKMAVLSLAAKLNSEEKKLGKLLSESNSHVKATQDNLAAIEELEARNRQQQESISQTVTLASKFGMAASFKERKDELRMPIFIWGVTFVAAMLGLFATGVFYILPHIAAGQIPGAAEILVKFSLIGPLVWMGWMAVKQYGYLSRIREDYSFKYASALAFEGYKKEAAEVNQEMLRDLLKVATENMAFNPLRIYHSEDPNHASPIHELISGMRRPRHSPKITSAAKETGESLVNKGGVGPS